MDDKRSEKSESAIEKAREEVKDLRVLQSYLEEQNEFLKERVGELQRQNERLREVKEHDHCCNECRYHSDPHKRCVLR